MKELVVKERVLMPKRCKNPNHWQNIVIYGGCATCGRALAKFEEKTKLQTDKLTSYGKEIQTESP